MGHEYIKESDTFSTSQNGTVPKPTASDVSNNKVLRADGNWVSQSGGGGGGSSTLAGLDDVDTTGVSDGDLLGYDSNSNKWIPQTPSSEHTYSTTEQVVGTWIDGKPLYEKTIDYGNNVMVGYDSQVHTELLHGISNIGIVVNLFIICTGMNAFNDSLLTNSDGSVCCKFLVDSTRIYASGGSNHYGARADRYWYFTIQYTKTTD